MFHNSRGFKKSEFESRIFQFLSQANNFSFVYSEGQCLQVTQHIDGTTFNIQLDSVRSVVPRKDPSVGDLLQINLAGESKLLLTPVYIGFRPDGRGMKDHALIPKVATSGDLICIERLLIEMIMDSEGGRPEDHRDIDDIYSVYKAIFKGAKEAGLSSDSLLSAQGLSLSGAMTI